MLGGIGVPHPQVFTVLSSRLSWASDNREGVEEYFDDV